MDEGTDAARDDLDAATDGPCRRRSRPARLGRAPELERRGRGPLFATFFSLTLAQLPLVVFGVLVVGSEYSSGTVRASLLATPARARLFAGKLLVAGLLAAAASLVTVAATFAAAQLALGPYGRSPLDGDAPRTLAGSWLYLTLICLFAVGVAWLVRSSAVSLGVLLPLLFLGAQGIGNIPRMRTVLQFLPDQAGQLIMHIVGPPDDPLVDRAYGPWTPPAIWRCAAATPDSRPARVGAGA